MQSKHTLTVWRRERTGSRYARRERLNGRLPAILYGHGRDPVSLALDSKEALRLFESGERVFTVQVKDEGATQTVMLKDVQFDYLGTNVVHVDLARVDLDEVVECHPELHFIGEPVGLKVAGAFLTHPSLEVTIKCTVANMPERIDVDISGLGENDVVHASQIVLPAGLELVSDPEAVVAAIKTKKDDDSLDAEAQGVDGAAEPEVIKERKTDEDNA